MGSVADVEKEATAPEFVHDSRALLAAIVESSEDAILSKTLQGIITSWNRGAEQLFGYDRSEMLGNHISVLFPPDRIHEEDYILSRIKQGQAVEHYETVRRRKDGSLVDISLTVSPVRGAQGNVIGASKIARDITSRKRFEVVERALAREVNHRSKNLLAVVQAIVRQTAQNSAPAEITRRISERLQALSANQDLLIHGHWQGMDLRRLIEEHVKLFPQSADARITLTGRDVMLEPVAAQALGLAIHELVANALRHGSLTLAAGAVAVGWTVTGPAKGRIFRVSWRESGGPTVHAPTRTGFGSTILQRMVCQALNGKVRQEFGADGYRWTLEAPAGAVLVETPITKAPFG